MKITGKLSEQQKSAIQFFADKLLSKQMQRYVSVHVLLVRKFEFLGLTHPWDYNSKDAPREFTLEIRKDQSEEEFLVTLAHEMVHVKQYAYKELNEEMTKWKGQMVCPRSIPYDDQPWEIEAETRAKELYNEYEQFRTIHK